MSVDIGATSCVVSVVGGSYEGRLLLEDGTVITGEAFGYTEEPVIGEVVFNTAMTGYQEILTDPSYFGQMVVMTYPLIGNYGIRRACSESEHIQVRACIVREACIHPSHPESRQERRGVLWGKTWKHLDMLTASGQPWIFIVSRYQYFQRPNWIMWR